MRLRKRKQNILKIVNDKKLKIGFTTSFPMEPILAAGHQVVDLNNIFISENSRRYIQKAESDGYPRNICSWIKGIYGVMLGGKIDYIMGIVQGDCSNTHSLLITLQELGFKTLQFSFPYDRDKDKLAMEIENLEEIFGVNRSETNKIKFQLDKIRKKLIKLDELTWREGKVSGSENHLWLVSSSDFNGDSQQFEKELDDFLRIAEKREVKKSELRLGYLGVPPIFDNLYEFLEEEGAQVVFNEIQRQFAMPSLVNDIVDQYWHYTYPYTVKERISDIKDEVSIRKLDGVISYTQSFCHRQIDNLVIRKYLDLPFLTLEGDQPGSLDARTRLRLESFMDMLRYR